MLEHEHCLALPHFDSKSSIDARSELNIADICGIIYDGRHLAIQHLVHGACSAPLNRSRLLLSDSTKKLSELRYLELTTCCEDSKRWNEQVPAFHRADRRRLSGIKGTYIQIFDLACRVSIVREIGCGHCLVVAIRSPLATPFASNDD